MKNTMKYMLLAIAAIALGVSCQREDLLQPEGGKVPEGYRKISFVAQVPEMDMVRTRAVDPDGAGVQQMTVFCFDANSFFITTVTADLSPDAGNPSLSGTFDVNVPEHTAVLQLVGNQNLTYFREDNYRGMSEVDVMAALQASPGRMIYWARETIESIVTHNSAATAVKLLRNQAKITLEVDASKTDFVQKGWVVVNSNSFGTIAPYSPEHGGFVAPTLDAPFITLPENKAKLGDYIDVRDYDEDYIFETENSVADPIDFIVKGSHGGGEDLYYRISLIDENGDNVLIMRNHHYIVNIVGQLNYGRATFEEALKAPATNNVWVSVSDNIAEVADNDYRLAVDKTSVVIGENEFTDPNTYYLYYTLESLSGGDLSAATVTWMDGNNVAASSFTHTFDASTGRGTIAVSLNDMGSLMHREGTLIVKHGRLSRKIKVVTVKEQNFEPAWVTTNIYGGQTGEHVTMMFTIPEDCPDALFPMEVLISVDALNVRNESGMVLPVRNKESEGYGEDNGIGYKYVLTVNSPGVHRIYLETILNNASGGNADIMIEARHFQSLTKTYSYTANPYDLQIALDNVRSYSAVNQGDPQDEVIYYYLVPQKINAPVDIESHIDQITYNADGTSVKTVFTPEYTDEFLFYSRNLDHREEVDFVFRPINESDWDTGGRVHGFTLKEGTVLGDGAVYRMKTNVAKSAEVVRIASNQTGHPSITGTGTYSGNLFRSVVFELANYHPFHFAATVNGAGTTVTGNAEEKEDNVYFSYLPGQDVTIEFDVTSFTSEIEGVAAADQVSVDPFGTEFDIYIDAPMLEIDKTSSLYTSGKITEDPSVEGRFIYHVAADRSSEKSGTLAAAVTDSKAAVSQAGERKSIPFLTKDIVSAGEIRISSDISKVVYFEKVFKVHNSSLTGRLQYRSASTDQVTDIPEDSFVPFEVLPTYNRIGTTTIGTGGQFEIRLRNEYEFDWLTDDVKFQFTDADGVIYEKTYASLNSLYSSLSSPIILEPRP